MRAEGFVRVNEVEGQTIVIPSLEVARAVDAIYMEGKEEEVINTLPSDGHMYWRCEVSF